MTSEQIYITKIGSEVLSCNKHLKNSHKFIENELPADFKDYLLSYTQFWRIFNKKGQFILSIPDRPAYTVVKKTLNP